MWLVDAWRHIHSRIRVKNAHAVVQQILSAQPGLRSLSDEALRDASLALRYRAQCGDELSHLLVEGGALVREAARRTIGIQHYDVQLLAGILLRSRTIAEMQTGEGKTLTALLPLYLHALTARGAHLATANNYLADRDARAMRPVFGALGMTVGVVLAEQSPADRRAAYACDVTYGTASEFGFDFLRDRLRRRSAAEEVNPLFADRPQSTSAEAPVQRPLSYLLADEADSLMIDEARTPLIISAATDSDEHQALFGWAAKAASALREEVHFALDRERRSIELTTAGREQVRAMWRPEELRSTGMPELYDAAERALRAAEFFQRDRHYVVQNGQIVIVDEYSGRPAPGRQWRDGTHQAIEAREGIAISPRGDAAARITIQEFFAEYPRLGGLTGTASTSAGELRRVYDLSVTPIPTHRNCQRERFADCVLDTAADKWNAIVDEVRALRETNRPILIGTRSIDKSEALAACLTQAGVPHRVLHARNIAAEADIVAQAGQPGVVTVATNMAGRGTDILLGAGVAEAGGLHIICSELHDSARIDRQLIGRCARQGDPGSFRQYLSLDDEILDLGYGFDVAARMRARWRGTGGPLDVHAPWFFRAQRRVEARHRADRRLLMHNARLRRELHERLGEDPFLDAASEG